ncbi:type IV pilus modification protein PilV [Wenzhouxiangella sp. XN79A]|uniref:type IV pilus modification protein PilV n=1 Tax=Wenzhouxiangella sp. XN79A TaxID=2724193 RepID=UPI00144AADB6|nr:type IV pilus modification protein PilV [Wenzhouxiangella sp. XN79A]NKI35237.1 type IV pilus modification protein PilV [Wenzhouxiangella sp. XN79A]
MTALFRAPIRRQAGVTLIEVLITLLVLSVGLLGVAALQGFSLQANQVSYYRTQATNIAYELADHARANRSEVAASGNIPNAGFWSTRAAQLLPAGTVNTSVTAAATDGIVTITVGWLDDREAGTNASFSITTRI